MKNIILSIIILATGGTAQSEDGVFEMIDAKSVIKVEDSNLVKRTKIKKIQDFKIKKISLYDSPGSARGKYTIQIDVEGMLPKNIILVLVLGEDILYGNKLTIGRSEPKECWLSIGSDDLKKAKQWLQQMGKVYFLKSDSILDLLE